MASDSSLTEIRTWKVLVAHADPEERHFLNLFLEVICGYQVLEAEDGIGLIRQLRRRPDLVLMDSVPKGNFMRALEIIRRTPAVKHLPVVVYTSEQQRLAECQKRGADGFIVNPASPAALLGKIWKVLGGTGHPDGSASSFADRYKKDLGQIDNLPTLPVIYTEVDRLCQDPDVGADQLSSVIENDPSITLKLLNLANSAFFGFSRKISTVRDAISLLGNQTVRNTILNIAVFEATKDLKDTAGLDKNQFWLHCVGVGSVARTLTAKLELEREDAFTAGIVHDMGKVILDALIPDLIQPALDRLNLTVEQLDEWEEEIGETVDRDKAVLAILKG